MEKYNKAVDFLSVLPLNETFECFIQWLNDYNNDNLRKFDGFLLKVFSEQFDFIMDSSKQSKFDELIRQYFTNEFGVYLPKYYEKGSEKYEMTTAHLVKTITKVKKIEMQSIWVNEN